MVDPAIAAFFKERKEKWLKEEIEPSFSEDKKRKKELECEEIFSLENWLPSAAKRSGRLKLNTHPGKFSHPSAQITPIIAAARKNADGYLRSGNIEVESDASGNVADFDVYKFLALEMVDAKKLIEHIKEDSELAIKLLTIKSESYEVLKRGFLAMIEPCDNVNTMTDTKVKQVYFPVNGAYHQLSVLSNSGIMFELKKRVNNLHPSDEAKELRKKKQKNEYSERGFSELSNLTIISYGGTKPQNISVLNSQNRGTAFLLMSVPPNLKKRDIHFPKQNFFSESFRDKNYREVFGALHKIFKTDCNNSCIREERDYRLQDLIDRIIDKMWEVRAICQEQYRVEFSQLKPHQKIWLCDDYLEARLEDNDWLNKLCNEITNWIVSTYEKLLGKQAYKLGEAERIHIHKIVTKNKDALR